MTQQPSRTHLSAIALAIACGAAATAANYDPTGQAGRYETTKSASLVRGVGAAFSGVKVWVPWLLDNANANMNSAAVEIDQASGRPISAVTTFTGNPPPTGTVRVIAALGTKDADWATGQSNNVFISEGTNARSNSIDSLITDGTLVWRANFSGGVQNNHEYQALPFNVSTAAPANTGTSRVFDPLAPGIDATAGGSVFLGVSAADRLGSALYTGSTMFEGGTGACPVGTAVYVDGNNNPNAPFAVWTQLNCPLLPGSSATDARQTQPAVERLASDCVPAGEVYACFGVGFSPASGTPFSGGSARPQYLVIDRVDANGFSDGYAFIDADGDNSLSTGDNSFRFVSTQATGSGTGPVTGGMFDINAKGQVVAIRENRSGSLTGYDVLLWNPIRGANCRITGYSQPRVIATAGQDTVQTNVVNTFWNAAGAPPAPVTNVLVPFSGVAIDDDGNVAFTAITEQFAENRDVTVPPDGIPDGPVLLSSTNTVFFWHHSTGTLHAVLKGGQNGDTLTALTGANLRVGTFPVDTASDAMTREGLSETGKAIAVCFRSQGTDSLGLFDINGGALSPNLPAEAPVRGVVVLTMGAVTRTCPGDTDGDNDVDFIDLNRVLSDFTMQMGGLPSDLNDDGRVDFLDLNINLSFFGGNCAAPAN